MYKICVLSAFKTFSDFHLCRTFLRFVSFCFSLSFSVDFSQLLVYFIHCFFVCAVVVRHRTVELFTPFITMDRKHTHTLTLSHAYDSAVYSDFWGWSIRVLFCFAFVLHLFGRCLICAILSIDWTTHGFQKTVDTLWKENEKKTTQRDRQR